MIPTQYDYDTHDDYDTRDFENDSDDSLVLVLPLGWEELDVTPVPSTGLGWLAPKSKKLDIKLGLLPVLAGAVRDKASDLARSVIDAVQPQR